MVTTRGSPASESSAHESTGPTRPEPALIGPWQIERTAAGTGLRRDPAAYSGLGSGLPDWSSTEVVPPQGTARRVVLLGESTARGWPYEDHLSPSSVLQRQLDSAGDFQCVDLSKVGANGEDLIAMARCLPALEPSVVVSFAGNNWMLSPPADDNGFIDANAGADLATYMATGLRAGLYAGMRSHFVAAALEGVHEYVELLAAVRRQHGVDVIIVLPEYDLQRFAPPPDAEVPALDPDSLRRWYVLRSEARTALHDAMPERVAGLTEEMVALDGGCSPVPGWLAGQAAITLGDGVAARAALEQSRDSVVGLLVRHTPRVTARVHATLVAAAETYDFRVVDLRRVFADTALPDLPDSRYFLDYCHLSDVGIERAVASITDAVLDRPDGTSALGPGLPARSRAFTSARIAAQAAFQAQPEPVVVSHLAAAVAADPGMSGMLHLVRELLVAPAPGWTQPVVESLAQVEPLSPFLPALVGPQAHWPELWTLLRCLDRVLGERRVSVPAREIDILDIQAPGGHLQANWLPPRAHLVSSCSVTSLHLGPGRFGHGRGARVALEYRTPSAPADRVVGVACGTGWSTSLPASPSWVRAGFDLPPGPLADRNPVLEIRWPTPQPDAQEMIRRDAEALDRREFPAVFPVHGEIYLATLAPASDHGRQRGYT